MMSTIQNTNSSRIVIMTVKVDVLGWMSNVFAGSDAGTTHEKAAPTLQSPVVPELAGGNRT